MPPRTKRPRPAPEPDPPERPVPRFSYLRFLVETYYDLQGQRIMAENRLRSYAKAQEEDQRRELQVMSDWVDQRLAKCEAELKALVLKECKRQPFARDYLLKVKGIGPCLAGGLLAYCESSARFATVSKLWAYCGLHVVNGEAPRRTKGVKSNWSPQLRRLCWLAGESFVKASKGPYRALYDQFRAEYGRAHPEPVDSGRRTKEGKPIMNYTPGHLHSMAKRKTVKIFLSHVWRRWREAEGLSTETPWIIARGGHTHYIEEAS